MRRGRVRPTLDVLRYLAMTQSEVKYSGGQFYSWNITGIITDVHLDSMFTKDQIYFYLNGIIYTCTPKHDYVYSEALKSNLVRLIVGIK